MSNFNIKTILKITSAILLIESAFALLCIPVALHYGEPVSPFLWPVLIAFVPGSLILLLLPSSIHHELSSREGYLSVTMAWLAIVVFGTMPYLFSGTISDFFPALFESTSGFTTTGATTFSEVESLPKSILFWRSLTHWIGGIGIIVLVIIVLPALKVGGYNLFSLEFSLKQKLLPKTKSVARVILFIYTSLTIIETLLLIAGGMPAFDSMCHSFGTVATGGFSTRNTSVAGFSPYIQYVIAVFMFISATSYGVIYYFVNHDFKKIKLNDEFGFYIFFTIAAVVSVTLILYFNTSRDFSTSFRYSFFTVISQITTTGFAVDDYMTWPAIGWFIMFLLLFTGGCTGSTTGGIKMARLLIAFKNIKSVFIRLHHPNAVIPMRLNGKPISDSINTTMILFIFIFLIVFIIGAIVIVLSGIPVNEAVAASITAMSNVGPGLGASGNMGNFSGFNETALTTMTVLMIIGRLELFTVLALFRKSFWER